jgi:hypothetical protein
MAAATGLVTTVSSATQSDHIILGPGEWALDFASAGAFILDIQRGLNGSSFRDLYTMEGTKVTMDSTGLSHCVVVGGGDYRMDVTTYNNPITMTATRCN